MSAMNEISYEAGRAMIENRIADIDRCAISYNGGDISVSGTFEFNGAETFFYLTDKNGSSVTAHLREEVKCMYGSISLDGVTSEFIELSGIVFWFKGVAC